MLNRWKKCADIKVKTTCSQYLKNIHTILSLIFECIIEFNINGSNREFNGGSKELHIVDIIHM